MGLNSCALVFFALNSFTLHIAWCTLFLALFGVSIVFKIVFRSLPPSLPPFIFFTVDSSTSSASEKESLGEDVDEEEEEEEWRWVVIWYIPKRHRLANDSALTASLHSGEYLEFLGVHRPSQDLDSNDNSALDYLLLLSPASVCDLIADETDRYACETGTSNWQTSSTAEIWTLLSITILMDIKRLHNIKLYWIGDALFSEPTLPQYVHV